MAEVQYAFSSLQGDVGAAGCAGTLRVGVLGWCGRREAERQEQDSWRAGYKVAAGACDERREMDKFGEAKPASCPPRPWVLSPRLPCTEEAQ